MSCRKGSPADLVPPNDALAESVLLCRIRSPVPAIKMAGTVDGCADYRV